MCQRILCVIAADVPICLGLEAFTAACRFPVRWRFRTSLRPGVDIVSEVTSVRDDKPEPNLFKLPAGCRQVPAPGSR